MPLYRPSELHKLGIRAKKNLSQNFLIDGNILQKIVAVAHIQKEDQVLEIGPGPGALTELLLSKGAHVIAIEKDAELSSRLSSLSSSHLTVICADALETSFESFPKKMKVVANLPYHITTPLIQKLIVQHQQFSSLTVMVQKEVGQRMVAEKNSSLYGSFSLFLQAYATPKYCFTVKPTSFFPIPSVYSCVIHMPLHPFPFSFSEEKFFTLTRTAFGQRRKMLRASLKELYPMETLQEVLTKLGMLTARPQELSLEQFALLFSELNA